MAHNQRIDNTFRLKNSQIVIKNRGYPSTRPSLPPEYPVPKFWTRLSPTLNMAIYTGLYAHGYIQRAIYTGLYILVLYTDGYIHRAIYTGIYIQRAIYTGLYTQGYNRD